MTERAGSRRLTACPSRLASHAAAVSSLLSFRAVRLRGWEGSPRRQWLWLTAGYADLAGFLAPEVRIIAEEALLVRNLPVYAEYSLRTYPPRPRRLCPLSSSTVAAVDE